MPCISNSLSEDYADFIVRYFVTPEEFLNTTQADCVDFVNYQFAVLHYPLETVRDQFLSTAAYASIPKLYSLLDLNSMDASGILSASELPPLTNGGRGVMIGFIDTGIDYRLPLFQDFSGSTRILGIWDQAAGMTYTKEQIDDALKSQTPLNLVPSIDTNGHGTALASIAVGSRDEAAGFTGAVPNAYIGVVKLKPAKRYLRDFFLIREDADAFQESDIMLGITYLFTLARRYATPLVICLGVGTNMGDHVGRSNLEIMLNEMSSFTGTCFVTAAGNETGFGHHYRGTTTPSNNVHKVELLVGENETGFSMELWAQNIGVYTIGFISPTGQVIQGLPARSEEAETLNFLVEGTEITVYSRIVVNSSGGQVIFLRFRDPLPGIWTIVITNVLDVSDTFHIWLPSRGFISDGTAFLRPDPDTIITGPGNAQYPITVGAYDHTTDGIYIHSSRGYSRSGQIKPEIAAPGVDILSAALPPAAQTGPITSTSYTRVTGTSAATAHVAGAAALLLHWGILEGNDDYMNSSTIKTYLIRGAKRNPALTYPNREFGYGTLDLYQAFLNLRL
ncbi:MAG: S8 family peptidase [Lachnospiraceae bacterium]|nr:S8 family peptidase [Lachnospiraceae bacterium]